MKISLQGNKVFGFRAPKNFNSYFTFFGFKLNSFWHRFDSMLNRIHDAILPLMLKGSSRDAIASYFMVTISDIFSPFYVRYRKNPPNQSLIALLQPAILF